MTTHTHGNKSQPMTAKRLFPQTQGLELGLSFLSYMTMGKPPHPLEASVSPFVKWEGASGPQSHVSNQRDQSVSVSNLGDFGKVQILYTI